MLAFSLIGVLTLATTVSSECVTCPDWSLPDGSALDEIKYAATKKPNYVAVVASLERYTGGGSCGADDWKQEAVWKVVEVLSDKRGLVRAGETLTTKSECCLSTKVGVDDINKEWLLHYDPEAALTWVSKRQCTLSCSLSDNYCRGRAYVWRLYVADRVPSGGNPGSPGLCKECVDEDLPSGRPGSKGFADEVEAKLNLRPDSTLVVADLLKHSKYLSGDLLFGISGYVQDATWRVVRVLKNGDDLSVNSILHTQTLLEPCGLVFWTSSYISSQWLLQIGGDTHRTALARDSESSVCSLTRQCTLSDELCAATEAVLNGTYNSSVSISPLLLFAAVSLLLFY